MEGTRNKPRCRPGLWPPIDVRRPSKEVGNRAGAADAAIVLVSIAYWSCASAHASAPLTVTPLGRRPLTSDVSSARGYGFSRGGSVRRLWCVDWTLEPPPSDPRRRSIKSLFWFICFRLRVFEFV